jgi:hypothetical protein
VGNAERHTQAGKKALTPFLPPELSHLSELGPDRTRKPGAEQGGTNEHWRDGKRTAVTLREQARHPRKKLKKTKLN